LRKPFNAETNMMNWRQLRNLDRDDLLNMVGLETRREATDWIAPALGYFAAGLLVGAGLGLMLAPKAGNELRDDLRNRIQGGTGSVSNSYAGINSGSETKPRPL
jgi:hypothetical protein